MAATPDIKATALRDLLFTEDGDAKLLTYAVLDGAACEELLDKLDEFEPENCCLYAGELEPDVEEVAPYLILLREDHPFTEWLLESMGMKPWGIFCKAPSTLREMRKHFRQFLMVKGPEGQNLYFRYYDPRVLSTFLPTCEPGEIQDIFGTVVEYVAGTEEGGRQTFTHAGGVLKAATAKTNG